MFIFGHTYRSGGNDYEFNMAIAFSQCISYEGCVFLKVMHTPHLIRKIKQIVTKAGGRFETLWDDISTYYSSEAYPHIHNIENLMRRLITYLMLTTIGKEWVDETSPKAIKDAISRSPRKDYRDILHQLDFRHLGDFLFRPYQARSANLLYDLLSDAEELEDLDLETLKSFIARSNWDRYFSTIVECDANYLDKRWKQLYDFRNQVAHNALVQKQDFLNIKQITEEVGDYLQKAFDRIDQISISESDKEQLAEHVASSTSEASSKFLDLWRTLEALIVKLESDLNLKSSDGEKIADSSISVLKLILNNELIEEDTLDEYHSLQNIRNQVVHGSATQIGESELQDHARRIEELIIQLRTLIKPVAFHGQCVELVEKHFETKFEREQRSRSLYRSPDGKFFLSLAVSKAYEQGKNTYYWFAFHKGQSDFLSKTKQGYAAFGCGSPDQVIVIPYKILKDQLMHQNVTDNNRRFYWHIKIFLNDNNLMLYRKGEDLLNISEYQIR